VVEKRTSDVGFVLDKQRHGALVRLSQSLDFLPTIYEIKGDKLKMEFIPGEEGLTAGNARRAGNALRRLHSQLDYPFPIFTGTDWLFDLAGQALNTHQISPVVLPDLPVAMEDQVLIHGEPMQLITRPDGGVVFIDIEGMGMGSRYQDLGFILYTAANKGDPALFEEVLAGYGAVKVDLMMVRRFAGVISIAYAVFWDGEARIERGLKLLKNGNCFDNVTS